MSGSRCESKFYDSGSTFICVKDAGHGGTHEHGSWEWWEEAVIPVSEGKQEAREIRPADGLSAAQAIELIRQLLLLSGSRGSDNNWLLNEVAKQVAKFTPLAELAARQANQPQGKAQPGSVCTCTYDGPTTDSTNCERHGWEVQEIIRCHKLIAEYEEAGKAQPEMGRVKGEDAWLDELIECAGQRNYLRTVLRAFAANHRRIVEQAMAEKAAQVAEQHHPCSRHQIAKAIRSLASAEPPQYSEQQYKDSIAELGKINKELLKQVADLKAALQPPQGEAEKEGRT